VGGDLRGIESMLPASSVALAAVLAAAVPVIDITDLYHPPQDPGDNFDLIAAYALPEVDLRAVVLDITGKFREPVADLPEYGSKDSDGPREPGWIPVLQLNRLFDRNVPVGVGPFTAMRSPEDDMRDAPRFEQGGVELILETLARSAGPVEIVSFGSARPLAVAYNRDPALVKAKARRIHLSAGGQPRGYLEWNVVLDRRAFARILRSDLPVAIYPCATAEGPFSLGRNNTYWLLPDLRLLADLDGGLRSFLAYAFSRSKRADFLRALDEEPPRDVLEEIMGRKHNVWETAVWAQVAGRRLVRRPDGTHRLVPAGDIGPGDRVLPEELRPCRVTVEDPGHFSFEPSAAASNFAIYERGDPAENEKALREALPALYRSFRLPRSR